MGTGMELSMRSVSAIKPAKQRLPIDHLLQWAYQHELVKQEYADGPLAGIPLVWLLGTKIDKSTIVDIPLAGVGAPHPDALLIDGAVRRLQEVSVDWKSARGLLLGNVAACASEDDPALKWMATGPRRRVPAERIERMGELRGFRLMRGPAFEQARAAQSLTPIRSISLTVMHHARMGTTPAWQFAPQLKRMTGRNGKPVVNGITNGRRYGLGAHCPLQLVPDIREVACARFEYCAWYGSLMSLAKLLNESWELDDYTVLPPSVGPFPWLDRAH